MQENNTSLVTLPPAERAAVALGSSNTEKHLRELVANSAGILTITNKAGRDECHSAYMALKNGRCDIVNLSDDVTEDAKLFTKSVKAEATRLVLIISTEEARLLALRDGWDAAIAAAKAERERKEAERVAAIKARIAAIRAISAGMAGESSGEIRAELDVFANFTADDSFMEFKDEASQASKDTVAALGGMLDKAVAAEAEAVRVEAERAELALLRAEAAERERVAAESKRQLEAQQAAIAAERKAEADRMQAEREAFEAEKAAFTAKLQAQADAHQRRKDELAAAERQPFNFEEMQKVAAGYVDVVQNASDELNAQQAIAAWALPLSIDTPEQAAVKNTMARNWLEAVAAAPSVDISVIGLPVLEKTPTTPPTLRLGQICTRLGFTITADFLRQIGFEPAGRDKAAVLYHESDFHNMCAALVAHIEVVAVK